MPDPVRSDSGRVAAATAALVLASLVLTACDDGTALCDPALQDCGQVADTGGPDVVDETGADAPPDGDADADGIPDDVEGDADPDDDGLPNYLDDDSDGDGLPDAAETDSDEDEDGVPSYLDDDSDGDGFPDADEGVGDPDEDGLPNSRDTDSDGDGMSDELEGDVDSDGDRLLDRYDMDSDDDTIPDEFERTGDPDEDDIPNYLDDDSDGDGWTDAEEYGRVPGSGAAPVESGDEDGVDDFLDLDSDGDGLPDHLELGCPDSTDRTNADSDGDHFTDLIEVSFTAGGDAEGQACDSERDIADDVDFFFELPYLAEEAQEAPLDFLADVRRADIAFNMDTTGSMGGEVSQLQTSLTTVLIPALSREIADSAYAFSQFDDFPCSYYGGGVDRPFILRQRVTTSVAAATVGVSALELHSGGDYFESGFESIYQVCTGHGRNDACSADVDVLAFDPDAGRVPDVADGDIGGVGFRDGALPIIVHITDAPSHVKGEGSPVYRHGASRNETYAAMRAIGAKLIGVASGDDARAHLEQMAVQAGSVVPACAWTDPIDGGRPFGCGASQCCTGGSGVGRAPTDGICPLVYDISSSGAGLDSSVVAGVQALINFASFDLTTRVRPDEEWLARGIDTSLFIESVVPESGTAPATGCGTDPEMADLDRDGVLDHFIGVVPGSELRFRVVAYNDAVPPATVPIVYNAWIDVVQQGGAVLDTRLVTILVPPALKPPI